MSGKSHKPQKTEFEKILEQRIAEEEAAAKEKEKLSPEGGQPEAASGGETQADVGAEVAAEIAALREASEYQKDQLLRLRADFDNYRKRMLREMDQVRLTASANVVKAILPALDNLERALAHAQADNGIVEGVRLVYKQMLDALMAEGLAPIPAKGEPFNPAVHDALAAIPSESVPAGIILEEYEKGYTLNDVVLRPTKVIVSSGPESQRADPIEENMSQENVPDDKSSSETIE